MILSTSLVKLFKAPSAISMRLRPSKLNGLVTTPTVKMPFSLAICATTGAAPEPVPPPIPAVINTIFTPSKASAILSLASSAAILPTSGRAPAPKPCVISKPS